MERYAVKDDQWECFQKPLLEQSISRGRKAVQFHLFNSIPLYIFFVVMTLFTSGRSNAAINDNKLEQALSRTESAMQGREFAGDVGFLITQGALRRGKSLDLKVRDSLANAKEGHPSSLEYALWQLGKEPLPPIAFDMPDSKDESFNPKMANLLRDSPDALEVAHQQLPWVFAIMGNALKCSGLSTPRSLVGEPDYEYISTHQAFGLIVGKQRRCITNQDFSSSIGRYALRLHDEFVLAGNQLSDIQVERAAILCMLGQCSLIPDTFISLLIAQQNKDGFWYASEDPLFKLGLQSREHTTALAYYLLAHKLADQR